MKISEQIDLFGKVELDTISIDDSAQRLGVSTATIRNWLKTGYLRSVGLGRITEESIKHFQNEIAGKEKLNQRANKSLKDSHNHDSTVSLFIKRAQSADSTVSNLGEDYQSILSDSYRNKEGVYYTSPSVVRDLFVQPQCNIEQSTFCDPCCGSGNFIVRALELGFSPENIFGYDVDPVAVEITKARIREFCGYNSRNIHKADFLSVATEKKPPLFDVIYTNPPWGKKLPKEERDYLGARLKSGSSLDTCSLFFFACLECLTESGTLGLLLPESFFNISTFESARVRALGLSVKRLVDYGKAFKGLLTKAQALVLTNSPVESNRTVSCESGAKSIPRSINSFSCNPKSILNLNCDEESVDTLESLFKMPHITLADRASWGLGIVTGNNKKFLQSSPKEGFIPVFKGSDISQSGLNAPSNYIPADLGKYQQVAPLILFEAREKLIYKFISSRLCFFCDTQQRFVLNSANMLIPNDDFPVPTKVLGELLSSDFMNWMFASIFNTHKILRGDLESLPIYSQFLEGSSSFEEESYIKRLNIERKFNGTYRIKK